jgi:PncC family amidohydrolase
LFEAQNLKTIHLKITNKNNQMYFNYRSLSQAQKLLDLAVKKNIKIVSAESCTGGLISALITEISGSSKVFDRGFVTYSNEAKKENLGVLEETLSEFGAVSSQVASQMAIGAVKNSNANLSIAITGIAGPKSDDTEKPVGLVFIASFNDLNKKLIVEEFVFYGNRSQIRNLTLQSALEILISQL